MGRNIKITAQTEFSTECNTIFHTIIHPYIRDRPIIGPACADFQSFDTY